MKLPIDKFFKLLEKTPTGIYSNAIYYESSIRIIVKSSNTRNIDIYNSFPENFTLKVMYHDYSFDVQLTSDQKDQFKDIVTKYIMMDKKEAYNKILEFIDND